MTCQTIPLFFQVAPDLLNEKEFDNDLVKIGEICIGDIKTRQDVDAGSGDRIIVLIGKNNSYLTMRLFGRTGLVTIDVSFICAEEYRDNFECLEKVKKQYSLNDKGTTWQEFIINRFEESIRHFLGERCIKMETMHAPIRRGDALWTYTTTSPGNTLEVDYDKLVHMSFSSMQKIEIYHSPIHGNVLYLDGVIMFSESDHEYNDILLGVARHKRNDYKGKDVLLLGGGGGSDLRCILNEEPNMVVMCEIDGDVVDVCRKHMRKACGETLDTMEGPHHKIIIGDGFEVLKNAVKNGDKYDYIVDDMSMFTVEVDSNERNIDVDGRNDTVLDLSKKVLKPGAKYLQAMDPKPTSHHTNFQNAVRSIGGNFTRRDSPCIPSFLENYVFYEVTFPLDNIGK